MSVKSFAASEGGGLPQMDISSYSSQIFWLIITFGILYIFMWKIAIPQLRTTVEERKDKISNDLSDAEQLKIEAQSILEEYEAKITSSNIEAISIFNNTKSDIALCSNGKFLKPEPQILFLLKIINIILH